ERRLEAERSRFAQERAAFQARVERCRCAGDDARRERVNAGDDHRAATPREPGARGLPPAAAEPGGASSFAHGGAGRADLEHRLTEALSRLRAEIHRADRLESEAQAAREQIAAIHRDIVLDYLYGLDLCPPLAVAILETIERDGALVIAQRRVA